MKLPTHACNRLLTIDFETFYSKDFTLSKLTTAEYILDPRFQTIGVGVKEGDGPARWFEHAEFVAWAAQQDWNRIAALAHHAQFDGAILAWRYGIRPGFWLDTLSMSRAVNGVEVGGSLKRMAEKYGLGVKGTEVVEALGKRREDFTPEDYARYGDYCKNDCDLEYALFQRLAPSFGDLELWNIDTTVRMFTEPSLVGDVEMLDAAVLEERAKKDALLARAEMTEESLQSNEQFAKILFDLGVEPPTKISARTGKEAYAFAKTDPGMQELVEHERDEVRWIAEARVGVKSTINETRAMRLARMAKLTPGHLMPVYLKYYGAHTGRWSGGDKVNMQNLTRGGVLRRALGAPQEAA